MIRQFSPSALLRDAGGLSDVERSVDALRWLKLLRPERANREERVHRQILGRAVLNFKILLELIAKLVGDCAA